MHDIGLRRIAVTHLGDVAQVDHRAVDRLDRQVAEIFEPAGRVIELDRILEAADLLGPHRGDQVLGRQRVGDILPRQSAGLHGGGIQIYLDLALLAPERVRNRGTGDRHQRGADHVDGKVAEVLLAQPLTRQRDLQDRHRRGAVVQDQRRRGARRHLLEKRLGDRRHLRVGGADIDARLKEDLDDAEAVIGIGLDVLDVIDRRGQCLLEWRRDTAGHLVRRQAGILPDDPDHRDADFRKDIGRRPQSGQRPNDQDEERENDERIWARQRDANEIDHCRAEIPDVTTTGIAPPRLRPDLLWNPCSAGSPERSATLCMSSLNSAFVPAGHTGLTSISQECSSLRAIELMRLAARRRMLI